jgi:hypothetical protein
LVAVADTGAAVEASGEATRILLPRRETNGTFVTLALDVADELGST